MFESLMIFQYFIFLMLIMIVFTHICEVLPLGQIHIVTIRMMRQNRHKKMCSKGNQMHKEDRKKQQTQSYKDLTIPIGHVASQIAKLRNQLHELKRDVNLSSSSYKRSCEACNSAEKTKSKSKSPNRSKELSHSKRKSNPRKKIKSESKVIPLSMREAQTIRQFPLPSAYHQYRLTLSPFTLKEKQTELKISLEVKKLQKLLCRPPMRSEQLQIYVGNIGNRISVIFNLIQTQLNNVYYKNDGLLNRYHDNQSIQASYNEAQRQQVQGLRKKIKKYKDQAQNKQIQANELAEMQLRLTINYQLLEEFKSKLSQQQRENALIIKENQELLVNNRLLRDRLQEYLQQINRLKERIKDYEEDSQRSNKQQQLLKQKIYSLQIDQQQLMGGFWKGKQRQKYQRIQQKQRDLQDLEVERQKIIKNDKEEKGKRGSNKQRKYQKRSSDPMELRQPLVKKEKIKNQYAQNTPQKTGLRGMVDELQQRSLQKEQKHQEQLRGLISRIADLEDICERYKDKYMKMQIQRNALSDLMRQRDQEIAPHY